jgi:hypothetical protein
MEIKLVETSVITMYNICLTDTGRIFMGEAKRRGSYEQRKQQATEKSHTIELATYESTSIEKQSVLEVVIFGLVTFLSLTLLITACAVAYFYYG